MKTSSSLLTVMAIALGVSTCSAAPSATQEAVYLVNCNGHTNSGKVYETSLFAYYKDASKSTHGEFPDDGASAVPPKKYEFAHWAGHKITGTFKDTGVSFTSNIEASAPSAKFYTQVGTGTNGFHTFTCYKDNKRILFEQHKQPYAECRSLYYCLGVCGR